MRLVAEEGFVEGKHVHVTLTLPDLEPRPIAVILKGQGQVQRTRLDWPGDFAPAGEDARSLSRAAAIAVEASLPFDHVVVASPGLRSEAGPGWHLRRLFAHDAAQFQRQFFRHKHRIRHAGTQVFSLRQILDHYDLDEAHRAVAAVIYGYRAADSCDPGFLADAKKRLRDQLGRSPLLEKTGKVRTDRDHLHVSMLMTLWQIELALGDFRAVVATLDEANAYALGIPDPMATVAFNACRMMLLRGMIALWWGEIETAKGLFLGNFHFYVKCMERVEPSAIHFTEMLDAHRAAALSLQSLDRLAANKKGLSLSLVFTTANRVRSAAGTELLERRLGEMVRWLRKGRKKGADPGGPPA